MDLSIYREFQLLYGIELSEKQIKEYPFIYKRALFRLENLLGWRINSRMIYEEVGKTSNECMIIDQSMDNKQMEDFTKSLLKSDGEQGTLRLFPYNSIDTSLMIDPAKAVYKVKLVVPVRGSDEKLITIKEFKNWMPKVQTNNYIQYIQKCKDDIGIICGNCTGCGMIMVDGDWIRNVFPEDLGFILGELIVYEFQKRSNWSLQNAGSQYVVKSESVSNHSVTYDTSKKEQSGDPLENPQYLNVIKTWIGPYSPLKNKLRIL